MILAIYSDTGEIMRVVTCPDEQSGGQAGEGERAVETGIGVADDTHYIRDGQAVEKLDLSPAINTDGMEVTISGLPSGLTVLWDGEKGVTDDDPLELDHDEPGTYTLRIMGGAPYYDTSIEVTLG